MNTPKPILETLILLFDGGCEPNPGRKYGSFSVQRRTRSGRLFPVCKKLRFALGHGTNNEAEFESLEAALKWTLSDLEAGGFDLTRYALLIRTDSMIVKNRMDTQDATDPIPKEERARAMHILCARCQSLCSKFPKVSCDWVPRSVNVAEFGH